MALGALLLTAILMMLLVDRIFFHDTSSPAGTGSGVAATQARSLPPFTGLDLAGGNNVVVEVGGKQSVVVHADRNLLRRVTTQVRSGRLVIGTTPGNLDAKSPMFVTVSVPSLDAVRLQGAGNIAVTGIHSRALTVTLPGAGNIDVTGTATKLHVTIGGEGTAMLRGLIAATRRPRSPATAPSCSPRPTASPQGSRAAAPSRTAATLRTSPRRVTGTGTISAG